jgi:hypothetical protein
MEAEEKRRRTERLIIDRTSSMTVGQVERFWKEATAELLAHIARSSNLQPGLAILADRAKRGDLLAAIASDALEKVIGRE